MAASACRARIEVPVLAELNPPPPAQWPSVSIVIPACDEADTIQAAAETILDQDYPDVEMILIDDRSTDDTGRIIDCLAAADFRVIPVHITELPEGWLGKVHALDRGAQEASGQWLLLIDADVHLSSDTLRRAIAYCEHRGLDQLVLAPEFVPAGLLLATAMAMFLRVFCAVMRPWAVDNPRSGAYVGGGAFCLMRRAALDRTPGLGWLRMEAADDVGLGLMLKRSGARCAVANGAGLVAIEWYRSLGDFAHGVEKAFASAVACRWHRLAAVALALLAMEWAPLVTFLPLGVPDLWIAGVAMLTALAANAAVLGTWTHKAVLPWLLAPLGAAVTVVLLVRSGWLALRRGGVLWRGTLYSCRQLREGRRIL
jgi:glycosyltransferase involved in cell wall biosynthesis